MVTLYRMPIKSVFEFPTPTDKKVLTTGTMKKYRTRINKLATLSDLSTVDEFLKDAEKVIEAIKTVVPQVDIETKTEFDNVELTKVRELRSLRRGYLSALFWILADIPYEQRVPYYEYYLTQKDIYDKPEPVAVVSELAKTIRIRRKKVVTPSS
jgi:hypothetical protein